MRSPMGGEGVGRAGEKIRKSGDGEGCDELAFRADTSTDLVCSASP